jgi:hypothetical protein
MHHVPPYAALQRWMDCQALADSARLTPAYDDVLDVLSGYLRPVPVDEDWYRSEYPAVRSFLAHAPEHTVALHFQKHGYFERRLPFASGWQGRTAPPPFARLKAKMRLFPRRGQLRVGIECDAFLDWIKAILQAVPVDEAWYRATYPKAAREIDAGLFMSISDHYAGRGYFENCLPRDCAVDERWYLATYATARQARENGQIASAKEHFMRVGYAQGHRCMPA